MEYRLLKILQTVGMKPVRAEKGIVTGNILAVEEVSSPAVRCGIVISACNQLAVGVIDIKLDSLLALPEIIAAGDRPRPRSRFVQCGEQHRRQNRNDRDHDEQLNHGESEFLHFCFLLALL